MFLLMHESMNYCIFSNHGAIGLFRQIDEKERAMFLLYQKILENLRVSIV